MQVICKPVKDLTRKEYKACYDLNLRTKGLMQGKLLHCRKKNLGWAFTIFEDDILMAWCLLFHKYVNLSDEKGAYFYTRVSKRGQGYGTALVKAINDFTDKVTVYPCNNYNDRFFSKLALEKSYVFWKQGEKRYVS